MYLCLPYAISHGLNHIWKRKKKKTERWLRSYWIYTVVPFVLLVIRVSACLEHWPLPFQFRTYIYIYIQNLHGKFLTGFIFCLQVHFVHPVWLVVLSQKLQRRPLYRKLSSINERIQRYLRGKFENDSFLKVSQSYFCLLISLCVLFVVVVFVICIKLTR